MCEARLSWMAVSSTDTDGPDAVSSGPRAEGGSEPQKGIAGFKRVTLATHYWAPGWATSLEIYLRQRTSGFNWVSHGLFDDAQPSHLRIYINGRLAKEEAAEGRRGLGRFVSDLYRTVRWSRQAGGVDLFIAGDNLLALAGLWLRRFGLTRAVAMYSIDFVPDRFRNRALNWLYHLIDKIAVARADIVWNGSTGIQEARHEHRPNQPVAPQIVVPMGAHTRRIAARSVTRTQTRLVYLGHLLEKQGVQFAIEALVTVRKQFAETDLLVIGDGPYRQELERLAEQLGVRSQIEFAGFMGDHEQIEERLLACSIGLAPYVPGPDNYSEFTDLPGKIINYLACGLPVITTAVPQHARLLEQTGSGRVVDCSGDAIAAAIIDYLADPDRLDNARHNAVRMALGYDWDEIFATAFEKTASVVFGGGARV